MVDLQLRGGAGRDPPAPLRRVRVRVPPPARAPPPAAGLRPGAEALARVQPARRARRDLRDRARRLHRARPQPRARGRAGSTWSSRKAPMPTLLLEIGCEELPASACREAERAAPRLSSSTSASSRASVFVGPRRLALLVGDLPERDRGGLDQGPAGRAARPGRRRVRAPARRRPRRARGARRLPRARAPRAGAARRPPGAARRDRPRARVRQDDALGRRAGSASRGPCAGCCAKLDDETLVEGARHVRTGTASRTARWSPVGRRLPEPLRAAGVEPDRGRARRRIRDGLDAIGEWSDPLRQARRGRPPRRAAAVLEGEFDERFLAAARSA